MKRSRNFWPAVVAVALANMVPAAEKPFSRDHWIADFEQLKSVLTSAYPNLEWAVQRGMDLPALEKRARDQLAAAHGDEVARNALTQFLSRFGDGHMSLNWSAAASAAPGEKPPLCTRLGLVTRPDTAAIARHLPGYSGLKLSEGPLSDGPVSAGEVVTAGLRVGVLRVSIFVADAGMCEAAIKELAIDVSKDCDAACGDRIFQRADAMLAESIEHAIRALVAAQPEVILVDVAGNGGGNDSAIAMARMLTSNPLSTPRMQFVRSPARAADLREDAEALRAALRRARGAEQSLLTALVAKVDAAALEAAKPCDLSPLWLAKPVSCSNLLTGVHHAGGLVDSELPPELRTRDWAGKVSSTARYEYTPALWTGPLLILVDGNSASATELFAAMLQDAGKARVIGAPSFGSGCGWTLPRQEIVLNNSGGKLVMPDCTRIRRDGSNELDGIQPDLLIGFRRFDTPAQRVRRLEAQLPKIL